VKVTNPTKRPIIATIFGDSRADFETVVVEPEESFETDDYVVASTLIEYGCTANPDEVQAARELWAERNRGINSRVASAAASEGKILGRRQATVDVATGAVDGGELKGSALAEAVRVANESGAGIPAGGSAADRRAALATWQASRGASSPLEEGGGVESEFVLDDSGELLLDDEGQPYPLDAVELDEETGEPVLVDGKPVLKDDGDDA
jgi:hypothetical protein